MRISYNEELESKEFEVIQFGKYQSEDNLKVRILIYHILKVKATFPLNSFIVLHCSANCLLDQMTSRAFSYSVLQGYSGLELD